MNVPLRDEPWTLIDSFPESQNAGLQLSARLDFSRLCTPLYGSSAQRDRFPQPLPQFLGFMLQRHKEYSFATEADLGAETEKKKKKERERQRCRFLSHPQTHRRPSSWSSHGFLAVCSPWFCLWLTP